MNIYRHEYIKLEDHAFSSTIRRRSNNHPLHHQFLCNHQTTTYQYLISETIVPSFHTLQDHSPLNHSETMHSISSFIPAALLALAASANALGCYSGFQFNGLHGGTQDNYQEVLNDINTQCQAASGKTIKDAEPFWKCTNWAVTRSDHEDCYQNCYDACGGIGVGDSAELSQALCRNGCDPNCDPGPPPNTFNHIDWAIEVRDGNPEKVVDYDTCVNFFGTELRGCQSGSEQNHDGFWIRIDPSNGACP